MDKLKARRNQRRQADILAHGGDLPCEPPPLESESASVSASKLSQSQFSTPIDTH
jgi:hypothetical protein